MLITFNKPKQRHVKRYVNFYNKMYLKLRLSLHLKVNNIYKKVSILNKPYCKIQHFIITKHDIIIVKKVRGYNYEKLYFY